MNALVYGAGSADIDICTSNWQYTCIYCALVRARVWMARIDGHPLALAIPQPDEHGAEHHTDLGMDGSGGVRRVRRVQDKQKCESPADWSGGNESVSADAPAHMPHTWLRHSANVNMGVGGVHVGWVAMRHDRRVMVAASRRAGVHGEREREREGVGALLTGTSHIMPSGESTACTP